MLNNSIKNSLSKVDIISSLILETAADINQQSIFLVVEGEDDTNFISKFVSNNNVTIYESYSGCSGVVEIVANHFHQYKNVIGIMDHDYKQLSTSNKIFFYDFNCLEMMILNSYEAFSSAICELLRTPMTCTPDELRFQLLYNLRLLGFLRKRNSLLGWNLSFKCIQWAEAFIVGSNEINADKIFLQLDFANQQFFKSNPQHKLEILELLNRQLTYEELLKLIQGHDFYEYVFLYVKSNRTNFSKSIIPVAFRCSYTFNDFKSSKLAQDLLCYSRDNHLLIIKDFEAV
jgi:hypothetical protein